MLSEIGSNFWEYFVDEKKVTEGFFWNDFKYKVQFLKSGRNAIKALCQCIKTNDKSVMLPIYTCDTVIQPFIDEGWRVYFYKINKDLTINSENFLDIYEKINPEVIFVHSFFGFDTINSSNLLLRKCKSNGSVIVEDMTQSLFSNHRIEFADYYVTSFRKFLAIPDGGAIISNNNIQLANIEPADALITAVALKAFELKKKYFVNADKKLKEQFREKYQELNSLISKNESLYEISEISYSIIGSCDRRAIVERRKSNYSYIYNSLNQYSWIQPVLSDVTDESCPLYLPVYVKNRKGVQAFLAERNIYCPVIWPKSNHITEIDEDVRYMYEHMLCIPIDQRYGMDEMNAIRIAFKDFNNMKEERKNG